MKYLQSHLALCFIMAVTWAILAHSDCLLWLVWRPPYLRELPVSIAMNGATLVLHSFFSFYFAYKVCYNNEGIEALASTN